MINLKPLRVAIIFDQQLHAGGGYQQAINAALIANKISNELANVFFFTTIEENINILSSYGINAKFIKITNFAKIKNYFRKKFLNTHFLKFIKKIEKYSLFEKNLIDKKIDIVYFLSPSNLALNLDELNYIITVWDLCHRDNPEFPEVRFNREIENRDLMYNMVLPRATAILADSEYGKINLINRYGIDSERIKVMPFQPGETTNKKDNSEYQKDNHVKLNYKLAEPYIFYPAQFWSHKNHVYLLQGLSILANDYGIRLGAIFSGSEKNNLAYIKNYVKELDLENYIRFTGFLPNEEIVNLYKKSVALVMPSYFGPTNLPPLEAFNLGVPVLYPDIRGLKDQVGDAALLIDLKNPKSMALHLKNLMEDTQLRKKLIAAGYNRLKYFDNFNRLEILNKILEDFRYKRICWR